MEEKGSEDALKSAGKASPDSYLYRLYFKGLIKEETRGFVAGFGVAICGQENNLLFQMKGPLHDSAITVLEAELMALKRGLTEAVSLGITHISIYCDHYQIFELVMGRSVPEQDKVALLMYDVQCIRKQLTYSTPLLVNGYQTNKFAYKLAMETLASEVSIPMPPPCHKKKTFCGICFDDDLEAEQMFSVALCRHQFHVECLRRNIQVQLVERTSVPRCPQYSCKSNLTIESCAHLLTPKLRAKWEKRMEEKTRTKGVMCSKCLNVAYGYPHVQCSCGHSFCYICGADWKLLGAGCVHRKRDVCNLIVVLVISAASLLLFLWFLYLIESLPEYVRFLG